MLKKIFLVLLGIVTGFLIGYFVVNNTQLLQLSQKGIPFFQKNKVIGFLPYWLLNKAKPDYSKYINTLAYFDLTLDTDGKILKLSNEQETEPGWLALKTGKLDSFFAAARNNKVSLSLVVFGGDQGTIDKLMENPVVNADNLVADVAPIMRKYGFTDLNVDIEKIDETPEAVRMHFTQFATEVKNDLDKQKLGTLTVEVTPGDFIKKYLINPAAVAKVADTIVVMAYDYHSTGSYVTGPVAPLNGAGYISEFDIQVAITQALKIIPHRKIILGIPLYGYEWETLDNFPRSAVIPHTGLIASNRRVEQLLQTCSACAVHLDTEAQEHYLVYKDEQTGTYHQIFYPDQDATSAKIDFVQKDGLGGIALWALGYEGSTILNPLIQYK